MNHLPDRGLKSITYKELEALHIRNPNRANQSVNNP